MSNRWEDEEQLVRDGQTMREVMRDFFYDDEERRHTGTDRGAHHRPAPLFDGEITDPVEALRWLAENVEIRHVERPS